MLATDRKKDCTNLLCLYICFLIAHLLCSSFTSPLYPHYFGDDSAIFSLMGKGITQGKILYLDMFDHKGPMIFFLTALGHLIGGRTGIFLMQCLFGLASITCLYFTGKALGCIRTRTNCLLTFVAIYLLFYHTLERGNLTEEYSQPFLSGPLLLFVRYAALAEKNPKHPPLYAFVYGVALGFLSMLRLNNAITVCAGIFSIFVYLLYRKEFANLLWNLAAGLLGMSVVILPIVLILWQQGALESMIQAAFFYNFRYFAGRSHISLADRPVAFLGVYFPMLVCCFLWAANLKQSKHLTFLDALLGLILAANMFSLWAANCFIHYFLLFVPVYGVFLFRYLRVPHMPSAALVAVCAAVSMVFSAYSVAASVYHCYVTRDVSTRYNAIRECADQIPEEERDSIIGYKIRAADYLTCDILPCYKYYTLQDSWATFDPHILTEFFDFLQTAPPTWLITTPDEEDPTLLNILDTQYQFQFGNEYLTFYRLR